LQIRDAPQKGHHKIIEFYDVRAAEAAVRALRSDLAGKKIKLETSRLGGTRRYVFGMSNHNVLNHISLSVLITCPYLVIVHLITV